MDAVSPAWLGADEHTSNTGELSALGESLRWLLYNDDEPNRPVLLKPDSEYAFGVAIGDVTVNCNTRLARTVQRLYERVVAQRNGRVAWAHAKAHSEHTWNDIADTLAKRGAEGTHGDCVPGTVWRYVRRDGGLLVDTRRWGQLGTLNAYTTSAACGEKEDHGSSRKGTRFRASLWR